MGLGLNDLITGGTAGGLVAAIAYAAERLRLFLKDRREGRSDEANARRPLILEDAKWLEQRNRTLREERDEGRKAIIELSRRVDAHDDDLRRLNRRFSLAVSYIRSLLAFIGAHDLSDDAPPPPSGLNLDEQ